MGRILLVARREYFAYITAWGFWLGLIFTPLILILAVGLPSLIASTQPARYFTVIDEQGDFRDALLSELNGRSARAQIQEEPQSMPGAPGGVADPSATPPTAYHYVEPPAGTLEALRPFLLGEQSVSGTLGDRQLYAVFIVHDTHIEYWSEDVVSGELSRIGEAASRKLARDQAFREAGIDRDIIEKAASDARQIQTLSPAVSSLTGEISFADRAPHFLALGLSFLLWLLIFSVVNYLLTGTIEERSNKIFDSLLTSISLPQLLTGKLLGVLGLSLTLIGVWGGTAGLLFLTSGAAVSAETADGLKEVLNLRLLLPALISFILGYLIYGALFLALGSLCDSIQEAQALLSPVFIIMMVPLLMLPVSISSPDSPLLNGLSWVPLLTPFLLILRIPNDLSLTMIILQCVWMAVFAILTIRFGTQVYRAGAVHGAGIGEVRKWIERLFGQSRKSS